MTKLLRPFSGYVPSSEFGHRVVGPPRSVLSPDQWELAKSDPYSFRHIAGRRAGSSKRQVMEWLDACVASGVLRRVGPVVLVYRVVKGDLVAAGVVADVSISAYRSGLVRRHEATISKTESKMVEYMRTSRVHGNPVSLSHRPNGMIRSAIEARIETPPDINFVAADGCAHSFWIIEGTEGADFCEAVDDPLYITDGHHRISGASLAALQEGRMDAYLPAGLFALGELRIGSLVRCVVESGVTLPWVVDYLADNFVLTPVDQGQARPSAQNEFGAKIGQDHFLVGVHPSQIPDDVYGSLGVSLLQDLVLDPVFAITDPRHDSRLHFAPDLLPRASVLDDCDAWFLPYPAPVEDVMAVADMGRAMPPKSTWFSPKLPSGLVIRSIDV